MFVINGIKWNIVWCDIGNNNLMRSDGSSTIGMTDWNDRCVYLAKGLKGELLRKVLAHELVHCFCFSYDVYIPIDEEERMANWVALYGAELVYLLEDLINTAIKKAYVV